LLSQLSFSRGGGETTITYILGGTEFNKATSELLAMNMWPDRDIVDDCKT